MRVISTLKLFSLLAFSLMLSACDTSAQYGLTPPAATGQHAINFQLPANWKLASSEKDPGGYFQSYRPEDSLHAANPTQLISINYGTGNIQSPVAGMQEYIQAQNSLGCHVENKLLSQQKNSITFISNLSQCSNGKALNQTVKIFSMPEGHYSISYGADPQVVSAATMREMSQIVRSSQIAHQ